MSSHLSIRKMPIDESPEDEEEVPTAQTTITSYCSSDVINEVMNPLIEQGLKAQNEVSVLWILPRFRVFLISINPWNIKSRV